MRSVRASGIVARAGAERTHAHVAWIAQYRAWKPSLAGMALVMRAPPTALAAGATLHGDYLIQPDALTVLALHMRVLSLNV